MLFIYNSTNVPIYISLGEALAAFGLILAAYQLRKPEWEMILKIRNHWQKNLVWILGTIALFLVLLKFLFFYDFVIDKFSPEFNWPKLLDFFSYIFFIAAPLFLIVLSSKKKNLFNKKNAERFYNILVIETSKNENEKASLVIEIFIYNLETICRFIKEGEGKEKEFAKNIINFILGDKLIIKMLTTIRLSDLDYLLFMIDKFEIKKNDSYIGIQRVVNNLFYDRESFFYKQLDNSGYYCPLDIYERIFNSSNILSSFNLFDYPATNYVKRQNLDIIGVKVFLKALSLSIETYLKNGNVKISYINDGLSYLSEIFRDVCFRIIEKENDKNNESYIKDKLNKEWEILDYIVNFSGEKLMLLVDEENINQAVKDRERSCNNCLSQGISNLLYSFVRDFSGLNKNKNYDNYDYYRYSLVVNYLFHGIKTYRFLNNKYVDLFGEKIWEQIDITINNRYYPAVLKVYLCFFASYLTLLYDGENNWIDIQRNKLGKLLYGELKDLIDNKEKMSNGVMIEEALLPQNINYKNNKFYIIYNDGSVGNLKEVEILSPYV